MTQGWGERESCVVGFAKPEVFSVQVEETRFWTLLKGRKVVSVLGIVSMEYRQEDRVI